MKIKNLCAGGVLVLALVLDVTMALAAPARLVAISQDATGGDSVTGAGEWGIVVNEEAGGGYCELLIYRMNYHVLRWEFFNQEVESNPQCDRTRFGESSSLAGDVLVVGAPGWSPGNNRGAIFIYRFDGNTWTSAVKQHSANDPQSGSDFGSSVSITRNPGTNEYLIAVGAPLKDNGGATDAGGFEVWLYNAVTNSLQFVDSRNGSGAFANVGQSITTDWPFVLVGAPGVFDVGNGGVANGAGVTFEAVNNDADAQVDVLADRQFLYGPDNAMLGSNVSMSADFVQVSGPENAYVFDNSDDAASRDYVIREAGGIPVAFPSNGGGDVSQSFGVASFSEQLGATNEGIAYLLRDPVTDDFHDDAILLVPGVIGDTSDIHEDIRLVRESIWFANPLENRAFLYEYPAGFGAKTEPMTYVQRSIPCDTGMHTVAEVFADLGTNGIDYAVYRYDDTGVTDDHPYEQMVDMATFDPNTSVWLITANGGYAAVNVCDGFSEADFWGAAVVGGVDLERVKAQKAVALPDAQPDPDTGEVFARVMINNPYPREVHMGDIRYQAPDGTVKTLQTAQVDDEVSATFYIYDQDNPNIPSGQNYRAITTTAPPLGGTIKPQQGVWVRVMENGTNTGQSLFSHHLLMPVVE